VGRYFKEPVVVWFGFLECWSHIFIFSQFLVLPITANKGQQVVLCGHIKPKPAFLTQTRAPACKPLITAIAKHHFYKTTPFSL